jgi:hypothetical protein
MFGWTEVESPADAEKGFEAAQIGQQEHHSFDQNKPFVASGLRTEPSGHHRG